MLYEVDYWGFEFAWSAILSSKIPERYRSVPFRVFFLSKHIYIG